VILTEADRQRFERFLSPDKTSGCVLWTGHVDRYGYFSLRGRSVKAHRVAFLLGGGRLTKEKPHVLHRCDNPPCCNPEHLFAGAIADNAIDKARKYRGSRGKSGMPYGVSPNGSGFRAAIRVEGKLVYLGTFPSMNDAARVAAGAKKATTAYRKGRAAGGEVGGPESINQPTGPWSLHRR
jgi:hypothetical protein